MPCPRTARRAGRALVLLGAIVATAWPGAGARADKIRNPTAVFSGLDKITGRIVTFEVAVDETVQFGALQLTPRVCYSRPPTENPNTTSFIEVDEVTLENKYRRIFTGWMFAASPGLHAIEHAIYDVWLNECKGGTEIIAEPKDQDDAPALAARPERSRRQAQQPAGEGGVGRQASRGAAGEEQRVDVAPLRGVPVQPRQAPSRRFFPTNGGPGASAGGPLQIGPDPAGNNR